MDKTITYWEKQLILYTKFHYGSRKNQKNDVKHFAARLYDLRIEHVDPYNVNHMITHLFQALVHKGIIKFDLTEFLEQTFKKSDYTLETVWDSLNQRMLDQMSSIDISKTNLDLGTRNLVLLEEIKEVD